MNYKTFDDLQFRPWPSKRELSHLPPEYKKAKQAILMFDNGYGVSVIIGKVFYSNGVDTYELAVLHGDKLVYPVEVCPDNDVLGRITREEVTEAMKKVQDLKSTHANEQIY